MGECISFSNGQGKELFTADVIFYMHIYGLCYIRYFETMQSHGDVCMGHQTLFVNRHVLLAFIPTVNLTLLVYQQRYTRRVFL